MRGAGPPGCPQVTVPISVPLQRAQAALRGSKQAHKHAVQLALRANETQRELARQERMAEELRGGLEEAEQVSQDPWGWLCPPVSSQSQEGFVRSPEQREQQSMGNALGLFLGSGHWVISAPDPGVCVARWGQR